MDEGTPHELLLALAGRVDDDLLDWARELVAVGEDARAVELVTATLVADRAVLPAPVRDALVRAGHGARTELDAATALPPAGPDDGPAHRFDAGVAPEVEAAVHTLAPRQLQGCDLLLTSRLTPAGTAPGPLPHPLLLVEVADGGRPTDVLAYQLAAALGRAGVHVSVEVLTAGAPFTEYHAAARRAARPVGPGAAPAVVQERPFVASWAGTTPPVVPQPFSHRLPADDVWAGGVGPADDPAPGRVPAADLLADAPPADALPAGALFAESPLDESPLDGSPPDGSPPDGSRAHSHTVHHEPAVEEPDLIGALPLEPVAADDHPLDHEPVELFDGEPHPLARSTEYNPRSRPADEPGTDAATPVRLVTPAPSPFGSAVASPSPFDDIAPVRDRRGPVWPAAEGSRRMPGASRSARPTVTPISRAFPSGPMAVVPASTTDDPAGSGHPSHDEGRRPEIGELPDPLNDPLTTPLMAPLLDRTFPDVVDGAAHGVPELHRPGVPYDLAALDEVIAGDRPIEHPGSWSPAWASGAWAMPQPAMPQPAVAQPAVAQPAVARPAVSPSTESSPATAVPASAAPVATSDGADEPVTPEPWTSVRDSGPRGSGTAELRAVPDRRTPARHRVDDRVGDRGDTGHALFGPGNDVDSSPSDDLRPDRPRPDRRWPVRPTPFPLRPAPAQPGSPQPGSPQTGSPQTGTPPPPGPQQPTTNPPPRPVPRNESDGDLEPEPTGTARFSDADRDLLARLRSGSGHPPPVGRAAGGPGPNGSGQNGSGQNGSGRNGRGPGGDEPPDLAG